MTPTLTPLARAAANAVDGARLWDRLQALARHGARQDGGVDRPALSPAEAEAKRTLIAWGRETGLRPYTDGLGNLFLRLEGDDPDAPPILVGSHLDSQPTGGRYDGTFGVLSALEAVQALQAAGVRPRMAIEVIAWTNEEGSRFAPGMTGSSGYAVAVPFERLLAVADAEGITVEAALAAQESLLPAMERRPLGRPAALYIEPHIEQAPLLDAAAIPVGIVTGMQGKRTFRIRVQGDAAHAGTAPRASRRDALLAAARMITALDAMTADPRDVVRFTVGRLTVMPNAPSVVAEAAEFSIDLRHPDPEPLSRLGDLIAPTCTAEAGACTVSVEEMTTAVPQVFDARLAGHLRRCSDALGIPTLDLISSAGHDARFLEPFCPTAMLFIPCHKGITHNPAERIEPAHATLGSRVLAAALAEACGSVGRPTYAT